MRIKTRLSYYLQSFSYYLVYSPVLKAGCSDDVQNDKNLKKKKMAKTILMFYA